MPSIDVFSKFRLTVTISLQDQHNLGKAKNRRSHLSQSHAEPVLEIREPEAPIEVLGHTPLFMACPHLNQPRQISVHARFTWKSYFVLCFICTPKMWTLCWYTSVLRWIKIVIMNLEYPHSFSKILWELGEWQDMGAWEAKINLYSFIFNVTDKEIISPQNSTLLHIVVKFAFSLAFKVLENLVWFSFIWLFIYLFNTCIPPNAGCMSESEMDIALSFMALLQYMHFFKSELWNHVVSCDGRWKKMTKYKSTTLHKDMGK